MLIPMEAANSAVLKVLEQEVLHPQVTDTVVRKALDMFKASQKEKKNNLRRVPFSPARSGYEFRGIASVGKLLIGHAKELVSPIGT